MNGRLAARVVLALALLTVSVAKATVLVSGDVSQSDWLWLVAAAEGMVGVALLVPRLSRIALFVAGAALLGGSVATLTLLVQGDQSTTCHCVGGVISSHGTRSLVQGLLLALCAVAFPPPSLSTKERGQGGPALHEPHA